MADQSLVLINTYYPLTYFSQTNIDQFAPNNPVQFWASEEALPPVEEYLIYNLGVTRSVNFIDFEICQKPIHITIQYKDGDDWVNVTPKAGIENTFDIPFLPSDINPWHYFELHFNRVETSQIRVVLARREEAFPLHEVMDFPWSIEVRNLRLEYIIISTNDYFDTTGTDILGNTYTTELHEFPPENVTDGDPNTYWQSQPNPVRQAVESLYFDLRGAFIPITMEFLDTFHNLDDPDPDPDGMLDAEMDERTMAQMETYFEEGVVIDEIYLDPITFGSDMHMYYSNDDEPDWDNKLWTPVNQHYIVQKGYHSLPAPIKTKYVKLEFTNLTPVPYNLTDYPSLPPLVYRKFPTWVQNYFAGTFPFTASDLDGPDDSTIITVNPLEFGFKQFDDQLDRGRRDVERTFASSTDEVKTFIEQVTTQNKPATAPDSSIIEEQIQFYSPRFYQDDLLATLDFTRALSRLAITGESQWNAEIEVEALPTPDTQSVPDLQKAVLDKITPIMWFPMRCRHGYQEIEANRPTTVAYFVAIREVGFFRKDYTQPTDDPFYIETLDDDAHIAVNEFVQDDWRFVVTP
jgi:hypothetical protein